MDGEARDRMKELLEKPAHYLQGVELVRSLGAEAVLVAVMEDYGLPHWAELLEAALAMSPRLAAEGVVLAAEFDAASTDEIAALFADAGLFEVCLQLAASRWGWLESEIAESIEPFWAPGSDPARADRICAVLSEADEDTWIPLYNRLTLDGWPEQAMGVVLRSALSHEASVRTVLAEDYWLGEALEAVIVGEPRSLWQHLLAWSDGLSEIDEVSRHRLLFSNLDDVEMVDALLETLMPVIQYQDRMLEALSGDWPAAVRSAIVAFIDTDYVEASGIAFLQVAAVSAPDDAARPKILSALSQVCPDDQRLEFNRLLLRHLCATVLVDHQRELVRGLRAPVPLPECAQILQHGREADVRALLAGLQSARDPATISLVLPMADGPIDTLIAAEAAETLGVLWKHSGVGARSIVQTTGLILAQARAGQTVPRSRLMQLSAWDFEAALAWCRLATLESQTTPLEPQMIRRALRSTCDIAGLWLSELAVEVLREPLRTGKMSGPQRQQVLALGDLVLAVVHDRIQKAGGQPDFCVLFVISDRADWLLDVLPAESNEMWWRHGAHYLKAHTDEAICTALKQEPARLDAARALPNPLGAQTAGMLRDLLTHPEHDEAAYSALMSRRFPAGGVRVSLELLQDPRLRPAALRLMAGTGQVSPTQNDWRSSLLRDLLAGGDPAVVEAVADSPLWLRAVLCVPQPMPALVGSQRDHLRALVRITPDPRALATITAMLTGQPVSAILEFSGLFDDASDRRALVAAICAAFPELAPAVLTSGGSDVHTLYAALTGQRLDTVPIDFDALSLRTSRVLQSAEIATLGDLLQHREEALLKLRGCGRRTINELRELVVEYGLALRV